MVRARSKATTAARKKRLRKLTKGFRLSRHNLYRQSRVTLMRARVFAFRDRKAKKRQFRRLWIVRINAACRMRGMRYSEFILNNALRRLPAAEAEKQIVVSGSRPLFWKHFVQRLETPTGSYLVLHFLNEPLEKGLTVDAKAPPAATAEPPSGPTVLPYGSWPSPIRVDDLLVDAVRLGQPWVDGDDAYWVEGRPAEGGRSVLVRRAADGTATDLTPLPFNARTQVHEYGGGAYTVAGGTVVFSNRADGRLYRLDPGVEEPVAITPQGPWRYGDLRFDATRRRFLCIREDHGASGQPAAAIVAVPLDGDRQPQLLYDGPDFITSPRLSPDGRTLAWLEWDHPDMPWDATRLRVAPLADDGSLGLSLIHI